MDKWRRHLNSLRQLIDNAEKSEQDQILENIEKWQQEAISLRHLIRNAEAVKVIKYLFQEYVTGSKVFDSNQVRIARLPYQRRLYRYTHDGVHIQYSTETRDHLACHLVIVDNKTISRCGRISKE